ncbi:PTS system, beta-glucoside-specific IIABC component [Williamsoniiplasma somnilux]|uniref:PTS system, beta-glucoside-specific IIABC component n=1 Tax=Williamsoniiplasma somnilux TaxID=215578 RepID=A0A2K8NXJ6_9MOLU|nr:PTS glucose transporter subunit IIABC [Williamsoniiplasma somnilux]ATZ18540.1 PTS system, beta-glucoside-specific IIABC component [Williamsoniiplasma somnilux]
MNMPQKVIVYSPCDGEIKKLKELNDGFFSEGLLGEGFYILPKSSDFYSPFENGKMLQIFNTKHAFFIEDQSGVNLLIHIGLDTVVLEGKPYNVLVKTGDLLNLKTIFTKVNFKLIKEKKLSLATPIVLDNNENPGWKFVWKTKAKEVKHGDKIGYLIYTKPKSQVISNQKKPLFSFKDAIKNGISFKNRYEEIASNIYHAVGEKNNYEKYYNCVTRLRFIIKDKSLVNEQEIKKNKIVKGIVWSGSEIQIIIGGEVEKLKEGLDQYLDNFLKSQNFELNNKKIENKSLGKTFLALIKGVIMPGLPFMIGVGILNALAAIFQQAGLIENVAPSAPFESYTIATQLIYLIGGGALLFMGIFFTYNAVKYFGGNPILGLGMGLILTAPILFKGNLVISGNGVISATPWSLPLITSKLNGLDYVWMKIGPSPGSIITAIIVAYIFVKAEKFAKNNFPNWSQSISTPTFSIFIASFLAFFIVSPIVSSFEAIIGFIFSYMDKIPFGLSIGLFALLWQPLVLTGAHGALITILQMPMMNDPEPYILGIKTIQILAGITFGTLGQVGAGIGLAFITKNKSISQILYGGIPAGLFGITEPIIFGANLPKFKPFLYGCLGSGIAGFVAGAMGATYYAGIATGMGGLFSILNANGPNGDTKSLIATIIGFAISLSLPALLVAFLAKDRLSETRGINLTNKIVNKIVKSKNISNKILLSSTKDLNSFYTKEIISKIKTFEKNESKIQNIVSRINFLHDKDEVNKNNLANKFNKYKNSLELSKHKSKLEKKMQNIIEKLNNSKFEIKIKKYELDLEKQKVNNSQIEKEIKIFTNNNIIKAQNITNVLKKIISVKVANKIFNKYWNSLNSVFINFGYEDKKKDKFSKQDKNILKNI